MKYLLQCLMLLMFIVPVYAADPHSPIGEWLGFYEDTDIPGATIRVTLDSKGLLNAYYVKVYPKQPGDIIPKNCIDCPGIFNGKPLVNLPMLWDLKAQGNDTWGDGKGFSLEERRTFAAKIWLSEDGNTLFVRGKVGIFSKTQQLKRLTSG